MKFLSIVVPVFNSGSYIARTIQSIIESIRGSEKDVEVILVDDGSKDNSVETMEKMTADLNNFKLMAKEHSGVSETRNLGIRHASGNYITFFDSDDIFKSGYVSRLMNDVKDSEPDFVIMDADCAELHHTALETDDERVSLLESLLEIGSFNCSAGPASKFYRTDFLTEHSIKFDPELVMAEDMMFNFDVIKNAKDVVIDHFDFYEVLESHSMYRFKEYNLQNELVFNHLLSEYFSDMEYSGTIRPLIKLRLTGFMFLLNWYFDDLIKTGKISVADCANQIKRLAEDGGYTEAFSHSEFDSSIGRKHTVFRKLMKNGHYKLVLRLNRLFWKIKN